MRNFLSEYPTIDILLRDEPDEDDEDEERDDKKDEDEDGDDGYSE